ncbi:rhodanese-like domain-containing protein [Arcticibacterium luteifluviistationis]|uniref:Rhodanese-like domain-containing protein n=1 Tax=Arcticibacterium luteifluviistationis TaxID=1784714 RepID=A0A2Z4G9J4_9BACT|nr:rhodanese-like domain-containing protein [Arcticibacterium luteifluviistationis]AWV97738.1 rhodanese-like domain-containing protein [Arcticibacterium luteifluviistationis]
MKKTLIALLFFLLSYTASVAQVESGTFNILLKTMLHETVPTISVSDLSKKKADNIVFLDAREKGEYNVSHLKNAKWIGFEDFDLARVNGIDKNAEVVIYCSIGVRSEKVGEKLMAAGYTNVKNLYGSIFEWVNQGHSVYDLAGKPTPKVHAYNKKWGVWLNEGEKVYE